MFSMANLYFHKGKKKKEKKRRMENGEGKKKNEVRQTILALHLWSIRSEKWPRNHSSFVFTYVMRKRDSHFLHVALAPSVCGNSTNFNNVNKKVKFYFFHSNFN